MALDDTTTKAIATEAWSQLVHSLISDDPPQDMAPGYYHTFPEAGSDALQKRLKRLEVYKYELGTERIRARLRSRVHSQVVQPNVHHHRIGIEHIQGCMRSNKHARGVESNEDGNKQSMEHIRGCVRSDKYCARVEALGDDIQQDIEHIQGCRRSNIQFEPVQANEDENQQESEHIRGCIRSNKQYELVQENEDENWHGIEHIRGCIRSNKYLQVEQANADKKKQGVEHVQDAFRSSVYHELVQGKRDRNRQRFKRIQDNVRSAMLSITEDYEDYHIINYSASMRSMGLPLARYELDNAYRHLLIYVEAKKLSDLFDELLELVENKDLHGEEKLTLRIQVLKAAKLIHHYGIDTIRTGAKEELEDMNRKYDDITKNLVLLYKKKALEVMLRICDTEACQRTIYGIIGKAESGQLFYKW